MSEIESGPPDSFSNAELVAAIGRLCREGPEGLGYWLKLAKTFAAENILLPLPTTRRGTGVHRRYSLDEVRLAAVLFHLKARGVHHLQLAWVAWILRKWLATEPKFVQLWNSAAVGETPLELNIPPASLSAIRKWLDAAAVGEAPLELDTPSGFVSEEWPPWIGINSAGYFRHAKVLFNIRVDQIFGEMKIPRDADAVAA